jgi:4-alpha-glucanotransferase
MQDLLGLGSAARMNTPGSVVGNWRWRLDWAELGADVPPRTLARARRFARTV